jgi:fructuronate reductase/mannitol 2-dehydrogenase
LKALALREETLIRHREEVMVPTYDRAALRPGVVHISVGSFHRSHQAVYLDDLARGGERDWGVVGVALRRPGLQEALARQDGLYTVVARAPGRAEARVVGAMTSCLFAPEQGAAVLDALADESTAVVTLTITGDAYDAAPPRGTPDGAPSSALGYLVEALDRRRRAGRVAFTVVSCDNLPDNGAMARRAVVSLAGLRDERLAAWIDANVAFPSSMVDRITPRAGPAERHALAREFGILDLCPVVTEPFSQWVLEDSFSGARPPLGSVGVKFVADVAPYALMKTRLLNASHCAIGFLGVLAGMRRADEVMRLPVFTSYVRRFMDDEVAPLLPPVPGVHLPSYTRTLLDRLSNPAIADDLHRLCRSGSTKIASHVLPSIAEARERGAGCSLLIMAVAGWIRCLHRDDERGLPLALDDPVALRLQRTALAGGTDPRPLLGECEFFTGLREDAEFVAQLEESLVSIDRHGVRRALEASLTADERVAA